MKNFVRLLSLLFWLLASCSKLGDCLERTGAVASEHRKIGAFKQISLYDNIQLILRNTQKDTATIEAGENLLEGISVQVEDETLVIKNKNTCNWTRSYGTPIKVYLNASDLNRLSSYGYGQITSQEPLNDLNVLFLYTIAGNNDISLAFQNLRYLILVVNSGSNITLSGQGYQTSVLNFGFGRVNLSRFKSDTCEVKQEGEGEVSVNASKYLQGYTKSSGNVVCYGQPASINVQEKGTGKFILK